jgi:hypothetical protein
MTGPFYFAGDIDPEKMVCLYDARTRLCAVLAI